MRAGILGGVFNPPHLGHLVFAQEAVTQLDLDVVVFVPCGEAPHRSIENDPGAEVRHDLCDFAVGADERFRTSRIEVDRNGPSYTVDTLRELRRRAPDGDEIVLLLGADQAAALPDWTEPEEVARIVAELGVAGRGEASRERVEARVGEVAGAREKLRFLDMPRVDISSTLVRERAAAGLPIRYLVPDKVANYIGARALYGAAQPAATALSGAEGAR